MYKNSAEQCTKCRFKYRLFILNVRFWKHTHYSHSLKTLSRLELDYIFSFLSVQPTFVYTNCMTFLSQCYQKRIKQRNSHCDIKPLLICWFRHYSFCTVILDVKPHHCHTYFICFKDTGRQEKRFKLDCCHVSVDQDSCYFQISLEKFLLHSHTSLDIHKAV